MPAKPAKAKPKKSVQETAKKKPAPKRTSTNAEIKARLMTKAEAVIDELLAKRKAPEDASLEDIEQAALQLGEQLEQAVTLELVQDSAAAVEREWPTCPQCGARMKAKGKRRQRIVTETGEVPVEREYYHCAACGQGIFPPR